ncbi:hypothetical protein A2U01_0110510, partial [Trifolium medium]|nr:hypothetical protein [Trifolium medium]
REKKAQAAAAIVDPLVQLSVSKGGSQSAKKKQQEEEGSGRVSIKIHKRGMIAKIDDDDDDEEDEDHEPLR